MHGEDSVATGPGGRQRTQTQIPVDAPLKGRGTPPRANAGDAGGSPVRMDTAVSRRWVVDDGRGSLRAEQAEADDGR